MNSTMRLLKRLLLLLVSATLAFTFCIFLKGNVKDVNLHDVVVQKDKISIQVYAEGETTIHFQ